MPRSADVTLDWADGTYTFRLAIGQLRELQEKSGVGPLQLLERLMNGGWLVDDAPQIIRLGLIGGGMKPVDALALVRRYVEDRPPAENIYYAGVIMMAAIHGAPDDPVGKAEAPAAGAEPTE